MYLFPLQCGGLFDLYAFLFPIASEHYLAGQSHSQKEYLAGIIADL